MVKVQVYGHVWRAMYQPRMHRDFGPGA